MQFLYDLRLTMGYADVMALARQELLSKSLCNGHIRLKTFYSDWDLLDCDIFQIIKCQPELQILGMYCRFPDEMMPLQQFYNAQLSLPMIFTLVGDYSDYIEGLGIFPVFYSVDRNALMPQMLTEHLDTNDVDIIHLSIYLIDSSDLATIHTLGQNMAVSFPQIIRLNFFFDSGCDIPSQDSEVKEFISFFPNLEVLVFFGRPDRDENLVPYITEDVRMAHVKEWEVVCPKLDSVTFMDDSHFYKGIDNEWI